MATNESKKRKSKTSRGKRLYMVKSDAKGRRHLIKTRNPDSNKARFLHQENESNSKFIVTTIESVLEWLKLEGDIVHIAPSGRYVVQNKIVGEKNLLIIANRKRVEKKLSPFVVPSLQED